MPSRRPRALPDRIELNMTPMIDVVFQLLAFFLLTLNVAASEGDFQVKMPLATREARETDDLPPLQVRLLAGDRGELAGILVNGRRLESMPRGNRPDMGLARLREEAMSYGSDARGPGGVAAAAEVEIDADQGLRYEHVMAAITQVSGYRTEDGQIVKLIERIKFGRR